MKIGVVSDTHGFLHPRVGNFLMGRDEIWHAGDIGSEEVMEQLRLIAPLVAVHGNIDDYRLCLSYPEFQKIERNNTRILITHIAGVAGRYFQELRTEINSFKPDILVCGHSHILKIQYFQEYRHLYLNPGAAGNNGFHKHITALRFEINNNGPEKMEVLDIPRG